MLITEKILQDAIDVANRCLNHIYPKYIEPRNIIIKFTRAESYWAQITRSTAKPIGKYNDFIIKIGKLFEKIADPDLCKLRLEECMIHELIHTIPKCNNHGKYFKLMANKVNAMYPKYQIQTQTSGSRYGLAEPEPKKLYEIYCPNCGKKYYYSRKPKYDISKYRCNNCEFKFLEIKKL